ncbi:MAG: spore coat protein [Spirochaetales bacterium]|nr:spore coat protein [Spirochaetales bacterium]
MNNFLSLFALSEGCYLIAEIGTSHQKDRSKARELIQAAAEAGAQCAKFQVVLADEILHPLTGELDLPGGRVSIYERFRALEASPEFYAFCKDEAEAAGLDFLASPFGVKSARLLHDLDCSWYKVASPELNHFPLLEELATYQRPLVMSTGVSRLGDIEAAWDVLEGVPKALLHCVTAYPAPPQEYNLRLLRPLSVLFGCPVGVSDHSLDPDLVPSVAVGAGARLIEKHFCLSRTDAGLDDPIALEPAMFARMAKTVRLLEGLEEEEKRFWLESRWGTELVEQVLGDGRKLLAESEKANYERTNRSLHAVGDLKPGQVLKAEDVRVLRTEKVLRPGLPPQFLSIILGKRLVRGVAAGQGLVWDDLLQGP